MTDWWSEGEKDGVMLFLIPKLRVLYSLLPTTANPFSAEVPGAVHQKNDPLLLNLKSVYVESKDKAAGPVKVSTPGS